MPYGIIVLIAAIALTVVYVLLAPVSAWMKVLVVGLLLVSFYWQYGAYLRLALGIVISLYLTCLKARYNSDERLL